MLQQSRDDIGSDSVILLPNSVHALSGSLGSAFSISLLFPFETARTRLQVDDRRPSKLSVEIILDLVREEGWASLYRGWRSLIVSLMVTNFVYFYVFYGFRSSNWLSSDHGHLSSEEKYHNAAFDLLIGILAGFLAVLFSNPFWVINTRLKLQGVRLVGAQQKTTPRNPTYQGIIDCLVQIVRNEGIMVLWRGLCSSLILVTNPAINFMIYEALKRNILPALNNLVSESSLYFCFGGFSKFVATVVTYPLQILQTRARAGISKFKVSQNLTRWQRICFWYRGLESKLGQTVLTSAIMLLTYEHIKNIMIYTIKLFAS